MSTGESFEFDPSLFTIDWGPTTEEELALNYLLRFNDRASESGQENIEPAEEDSISLHMPNDGNELVIKVGSRSFNAGHYEPLMGAYVVYPEFVLPGEVQSWQKIARDRRTDMIASFNESPSTSNVWYDQDHPDIIELLQRQKDVLKSKDKKIGESILDTQRLLIGKSDEMLFADEYTRMYLCLRGPEKNNMFLITVGAFNEEQGLKKRFGVKPTLVAQRPIGAPNSLFSSYESKVDNDELPELIDLVGEMDIVKEKHPHFDAERLALKTYPSGLRKT